MNWCLETLRGNDFMETLLLVSKAEQSDVVLKDLLGDGFTETLPLVEGLDNVKWSLGTF